MNTEQIVICVVVTLAVLYTIVSQREARDLQRKRLALIQEKIKARENAALEEQASASEPSANKDHKPSSDA